MPSTATSILDGLSTSIAVKAPCRTVATSNITLAGLQTIDGYATTEGDRVLVVGQSDATTNGIYDASTGNWTRSKDADGNRDLVQGTRVTVRSDSANGVEYELTSANPIVIGTTALTFISRFAMNLGLPVAISDGGTGADTASEARLNLGLIDFSSEESITGAVSLDDDDIGKAHVISDSGSPANYTVSLPDAAPVGSLLFIRVSSSATKLYTISGIDVGIDGEASRVMWRNESCLLVREQTRWTKISGKTLPFRGCLVRTASQSFASGGTYVPVNFTDEVGDRYNLDLCYDSGTQRFVAPRLGSYRVTYNLCIAATVGTAAAAVNVGLSNSGASPTVQPSTMSIGAFAVGGDRLIFSGGGVFSMGASDALELMGRIVDAGGGAVITSPVFEVLTTIIAPTLTYEEIPLW